MPSKKKMAKFLDTYQFFNFSIGIIFRIILVFLVIVLCAATYNLFASLGTLLQTKTITGAYKDLISDIFTLYILIELARTLAEYFHSQRLRLSFIVDAVIVFILRDIMMLLYMEDYDIQLLYLLTAMLLALGALRTVSVVVFRQEVLMMEKIDAFKDPKKELSTDNPRSR
ncbi:MAG: phosphate-starvation-inducible PsiE family protein [Desulfobulbales bacterium]|nr:phosphate-starvation-inducible PsiE family protein [Desulfobulbales bacterium]